MNVDYREWAEPTCGGLSLSGKVDAAAGAAAGGAQPSEDFGIRGRRHAFSAEPWAAEAGALDRNTAWWAAGGAQAAEAAEAESNFWATVADAGALPGWQHSADLSLSAPTPTPAWPAPLPGWQHMPLGAAAPSAAPPLPLSSSPPPPPPPAGGGKASGWRKLSVATEVGRGALT